MEGWLKTNIDSATPIDRVEFCRLFINAHVFMKDAFRVLDKKLSNKDVIGKYE